MNGTEALQQAGVEFRTRLRQVGLDQWRLPTPCDEWDVGALVNHVVGGNLRYKMILEGAPDAAILSTHGEDMLGTDPMASFDTGLSALVMAFQEPAVLDNVVRHPKSGEMTGRQLRLLRVDELAIHAWDLARAIGADDRLDRGLAAWLYEHMKAIADFVANSGMYEDLGVRRATEDPQESLLHLLGRK